MEYHHHKWASFLFIVLAVFVVAAPSFSAAQSYSCSTSTACTCEIGNSTDIDFTKVFKKKIHIDDPTEEKYYYVLSLCEPFSCTNGTDDVVSAVCQFNRNKTDLEPTSLGRVDTVTWTFGDGETDFTVVYSGGDKAQPQNYDRVASFAITIDKTVHKSDFSYVNEETDDKAKILNYKFVMTLTNRDAYGGGGGGGKDYPIGYIGLTLIFLLIIAFALYFIIGAIVNKKVKGAGGTEVVPCVGFWKELPFLLKDGCDLTISPCKALYNKRRGGSYKSLN